MTEVKEAAPVSRRARRKAKPRQPATADAIEIAMGAERDGVAAGGAAAALLEKQGRLIDMQTAREREELHVLRLKGVGRTIILALAVLLIAGIAAAFWNASRSNVLVVEPFGVPADLARNGFTGEAVAAQLLDEIAALQAETESFRSADSFANNWDDNIDVVIPQTGVSVAELWRLTRRWLGSETRIAGELVRGAEGMTITARVSGGGPAARLVGPEAEMDRLIREAALAVYAETQPYRHIVYLSQKNRIAEAQAAARRLAMSGPAAERPWGRIAFANNLFYILGDVFGAIPEMERALRDLPDVGMAHANLAEFYQTLGRDETALHHMRDAVRVGRDGRDLSPQFRELWPHRNAGVLAAMSGDYAAAALHHQRAAEGAQTEARRMTELFNAATAQSFVDPAGARALLAQVPADVSPQQRAFFEQYLVHIAASVAGDWPAAATAGQRAHAMAMQFAREAGPAGRVTLLFGRTQLAPTVAYAFARRGAIDEARALLAAMPPNCHRCAISRGQVAALTGDWPGAERAFAEAARLGPSLPFAPAARGQALIERGDPAAAIPLLQAAHRLGPGWAEPLKYWGDALAARGDWRAAERRYVEAASRAPGWGALHLQWASSLLALGRRDEARAKLQAVAGMDLNPTDRARLTQMTATAGGRRN